MSSHKPKKHLGQNFLTDRHIQQKIVEGCELKMDDRVVEIGPGQGAITRLIAPKVRRLICVETDRDLIGRLKEEFKNSNVEIAHADFLRWNVPIDVKVVGNIPYYISTPIVEKLIEDRVRVKKAYLTVQLEFGQRMAAEAGSDDYGALSCFAQYYADVKVLFKIKSSCFNPKPKVDSCFVRMDFTREPLYRPKDEAMMFQFIRTVFTQRRKNILNAASQLVEKDKLTAILEELNISPDIRPEQLNLDNFVAISNQLG
jgi:16S rRNA (adenine1518-N6/adenine1519-N6)-dimethyltransferase